MQINIVAVGTRQPDWVNKGMDEYLKRFPAELKLQLLQIPAVKRSKKDNSQKIMKQEADRIVSALPGSHRLVVLDESGKTKTTRELARTLEAWMQEGINTSFVIGGADGVDNDLKQQADELWSLSAYTLPHGLVRIMLAEQLYRACSLLRNHPYHRQ